MNYMEEATKIIEELYKNNPVMRKSLLELDADVIRNLGSAAQQGIEPEDVIAGTDGDPEALAYLRAKAERKMKERVLYGFLCNAYALKRRKEKTGKDEMEF